MRFARHLAQSAEKLKEGCRARISTPDVVQPAIETFQEMSYGSAPELWAFAGLADVFCYLRGGKKLELPQEWRSVIPSTFPTCYEHVLGDL